MTKKETVEEKLVKLMMLQNMEQTKLYISFYESEYSFYNKLYCDMADEEPLKIFKKKHKEWEAKRKELYSHISDIESKKMELYEELGHMMDEIYDTKKNLAKKIARFFIFKVLIIFDRYKLYLDSLYYLLSLF